MTGYTAREKETVRNNIFRLDTAIVRLLEKRLGYASELDGDLPLPLMREELLNLVIDENKPAIKKIMEQINEICYDSKLYNR